MGRRGQPFHCGPACHSRGNAGQQPGETAQPQANPAPFAHAGHRMTRPRLQHPRRGGPDKLRARHEDDADVVAASGFIGGIHQHLRRARRVAIVALDHRADFRGSQGVAQAVGAQQNGGIGMEQERPHLDEVLVVGFVGGRSGVAKHLVAAGVKHCIALADLAVVLLLAHGRMIRGQLAHDAVPGEIEARIAHVTERHAVALHYGQRQHTGHAAALGIFA